MDIAQYIQHPELLDRETVYDLRSLLALYPYYQNARLLLLRNLYLLHDPSFNEELRQAAIYITDRKVIFNLVEAAHYQLKTDRQESSQPHSQDKAENKGDRTISLINNFLDTIPEEEKEKEKPKKTKRKPTPADAAVDYVAYLLETEDDDEQETPQEQPQLKGQDLIDNFINNDKGKIKLKDTPEYLPKIEEDGNKDSVKEDKSYFTETLAKIYIKQGRYEKALEIIQQLNLNYPKKNAYFVDQIRFLEKLILNNKNNK
ncbi:tetratricopeptide repeat protein [Hallella absiana]|jgi:tetratricopeptide (TPR) repeat protein|uniref:tetratricopeptide repeat protein n=1 Tax=Hallella absiana TaxID=2925336 RepID=UPI0021C5B988|nr:tetratricopeptide repeat protein [Hallella absiana]